MMYRDVAVLSIHDTHCTCHPRSLPVFHLNFIHFDLFRISNFEFRFLIFDFYFICFILFYFPFYFNFPFFSSRLSSISDRTRLRNRGSNPYRIVRHSSQSSQPPP
ncbi:hypothetical protein BDQ94DRAFT_153322 [Aspergillus welwitschiae]|uniref:Uncharacterized protein n=1 Tax=Aspergillus welwitschiae TaxID=1341132 RepID=A0A3F3PL67_9EURO|nr:hypothetical protein BDQ94DRAFT_153322 [Aspergillus welwitschiae]RDH27674.1 hypothetical protein BDQ94DRAFT_153322 [Aspergillus welwitschiae]